MDSGLPNYSKIDEAAEQKINSFTAYMEKVFIGNKTTQPIYNMDTWNKYQETVEHLPRTNNNCEGFNSSWTKDVGKLFYVY